MKFENFQSQDSGTYTETVTEKQDYAQSPIGKQSDELTNMKRQALIAKTQSQLPLKTINQLMVKDESCVAEDIDAQNTGSQQRTSEKKKKKMVIHENVKHSSHKKNTDMSARSTQKVDKHPSRTHVQPFQVEEADDYEDMVTPTDDEGITSLNHTQKIPISLIKAKDKASVSARQSATKDDLNSNF